MSKVTVHAGDFSKGGQHSFNFGSFALYSAGKMMPEGIHASALEAVEHASEESVKRLGGTVGWGVVGGVLFGPVGLLAGLLAGGRGKDVTFIARFSDGRKFLGTTDAKTYTKIQAAVFN